MPGSGSGRRQLRGAVLLSCLAGSIAFAPTLLSPGNPHAPPAHTPHTLLRPGVPPPASWGSSGRVCCAPTPSDVLPVSPAPEPPGVLAGRNRDVITCKNNMIGFMRAAFGTNDDVDAELVRAQPYQADSPLDNKASIEGKIALVLRGSRQGVSCSFVDKARRVADAGAVGLIVVNHEDTLVSPGDSAREGTDIEFPVVGVKLSDADRLPEGSRAKLHFQPITVLSSEQRKHLRALSFMKEKEGTLAACALDRFSPSEKILHDLDSLLNQHELIKATLAEETPGGGGGMSIVDIEDVVDVATVLADNLGAAVVLISQHWFVVYRAGPMAALGEGIRLPKDGEKSPLQINLADGMMGVTNIAIPDVDDSHAQDEDSFSHGS